jgi:hypothetical protein
LRVKCVVNIVRSLLGLDESDGKEIAKAVKKVKKAEKKVKKAKKEKSKPDPRLERTSKFTRPVRAKPKPEEVEPDAE